MIQRVAASLIVFLVTTLFLLIASATQAAVVVDVTDYGAIGNGVANDAIAIQAALDSGADVVTIPSGVYSIAQGLLIDSDTTLQVASDAIIRLAANTNEWMISNRIDGASNITVTGGIWDGNNAQNDRGADNDPDAYTGTAINFVGVSNLELSNLTVRNPEAFSIAIGKVENFLVENINLEQYIAHPNQDGVHVGGYSSHGVIRNIIATTSNTPNDDMVAINSDDAPERSITRAMPCGPISDILVENIQASEAYNFVRILSDTSPIDDITVRGVSGGCRIRAVNMGRWRFDVGAGNIRNVVLDDFDVYRVGTNTSAMIDIGLNVDNLHITDFVRTDSGAASTLQLSNGSSNDLLFGDGTELTTTSYTIASGNVDDLWINQINGNDQPAEGPTLPAGAPLYSGETDGNPIGYMFDGNPSTFAVILDDTLDGSSSSTIPVNASAPVTGHVVFDMWEAVRITGVKLTSRIHSSELNPGDVDFFYYADDNPYNNVVADDIEGDDDIISITNHVFSGLTQGASEEIDWEGITARYIGMRVNSAYEDGPTYYNFQIAEIEFMVTPELVAGDANGDGKVDGSDVTILAGNWQAGVGDPNTETITWAMGDFNGDGQIDGSDVTILAGNWQYGVEATTATVPEPSTMLALFAILILLVVFRCRN